MRRALAGKLHVPACQSWQGSHRCDAGQLEQRRFVLFPDDGLRHELIDGEHYLTPSPNRKHQQVLMNLTLVIGAWLEEHPVGRAFFAPFVLTAANVQGVPELVVEIEAPGTRRAAVKTTAAGLLTAGATRDLDSCYFAGAAGATGWPPLSSAWCVRLLNRQPCAVFT